MGRFLAPEKWKRRKENNRMRCVDCGEFEIRTKREVAVDEVPPGRVSDGSTSSTEMDYR